MQIYITLLEVSFLFYYSKKVGCANVGPEILCIVASRLQNANSVKLIAN